MERYSKEPRQAKENNRVSIHSHRLQQQRPHWEIVIGISDVEYSRGSGYWEAIKVRNQGCTQGAWLK